MIGVVIALIIVGFASMFAMVHSQSGTVRRIEETQLRQISADTTVRKLNDETIKIIDKRITNAHERIDTIMNNIVTIHNATVDHYDQQIDEIIARMDQITADIKRIDHDEKDLRRYYVNYKQPVVSDHGVEWAKDYPDQEVEHD